jgi:hypothetical protein
MATYEWHAPTVLELLTRFSEELIREAQETADLPAWSGSLRAPALRGA